MTRAKRALIVLASDAIVAGEDGPDFRDRYRGEEFVSSGKFRGIEISAGRSRRLLLGGDSVSAGDGRDCGPTI